MRKKTLSLLLLCVLLSASGAFAFSPDLEAIEARWVESKYPSGSIHGAENAQAALDEISRARDYSERLSTYSKRHCSRNFLVNRCVEKVRQARLRAERRFLAVEVEAKKIVRESKKSQAEKREAERIARRAVAPNNPFLSNKSHAPSEGMPGVAENATQRAVQIERRQKELAQKQHEEAQHEAAYAQKLKERDARAKQREEALKKRAEKKKKNALEQEASKTKP